MDNTDDDGCLSPMYSRDLEDGGEQQHDREGQQQHSQQLLPSNGPEDAAVENSVVQRILLDVFIHNPNNAINNDQQMLPLAANAEQDLSCLHHETQQLLHAAADEQASAEAELARVTQIVQDFRTKISQLLKMPFP